MNSTCRIWLAAAASRVGSVSPWLVASSLITLAISWPWVVRLSMRALTRPERSSFSTKAPTITIARARTFRVMISRPSREPRGQAKRRRGPVSPGDPTAP